jgi:hypothetical protein
MSLFVFRLIMLIFFARKQQIMNCQILCSGYPPLLCGRFLLFEFDAYRAAKRMHCHTQTAVRL